MSRPGGKVAIIGGGMAALSAAWRLSEPGGRDRFESITVYQRGWRLGGKAASSRGASGRIEEHGLHIWLGSYENAFALLRECYAELDRATTDPVAPIQTWEDAIAPADNPGLADNWNGRWLTWHGTHPRDDRSARRARQHRPRADGGGLRRTGAAPSRRVCRFPTRCDPRSFDAQHLSQSPGAGARNSVRHHAASDAGGVAGRGGSAR